MRKIPNKEYKKILENLPICCVDALIYLDNKIILFKRSNYPAKGRWCFPGGRVYKNERLERAIIRKVKEETGINVKIEKIIGVYETIFRKGGIKSKGVHTINVCFLVKPKTKRFKIKLDNQHTEYKYFSNIEKYFMPYIKKVMKDSKLF